MSTRLTPEEKQKELDKFRALNLATVEFSIEFYSRHGESFLLPKSYCGSLRQQIEMHYQKVENRDNTHLWQVNYSWVYIPSLKVIRITFLDDDFFDATIGSSVDFSITEFTGTGMVLVSDSNPGSIGTNIWRMR